MRAHLQYDCKWINQWWIDGIQGQNMTQGYFDNFTLLSHESIMEDRISCNDYISGLLVWVNYSDSLRVQFPVFSGVVGN